MTKAIDFTVEDINFIAVFCGETRTETLENIHASLPDIEDKDMLNTAERVIGFLNDISDEEFEKYHFSEIAEA